MRILHVCDSYLPQVGGIELHVHDLAERQRAEGHDVRVATLTPGDVVGRVPVARLPRAGVVPGPGARAALSRLLADVDVVHAHASLVSPLVWAAMGQAHRLGVGTAMTMHSMLPGAPYGRALRPLAAGIPSSTVLTAVSGAAAEAFARVVGREVGVLPNGIAPEDWRPTADRDPRRPLTLVSTMRTTRRKRPLPFLDILEAVRRGVPEQVPLHAVLIGAGPLDRAVRRRLETSRLASWVEQTGQLDRGRILRVLSGADLYLAPARLESFGIAALEARCAGLPVVGMAESGLSDFVEDGLEGFLVHSDTEMADLTARLLVDPDRLRAMRSRNLRQPPPMGWPMVLGLHHDLYGRAMDVHAARDGYAGPRLSITDRGSSRR